jgi:hypothetical protein
MQINSSSKMDENMQGYDKKSSYFLGRHYLHTFIVNLLLLSEIYT